MPGTVSDIGVITMNKIDKLSALVEFVFESGRKTRENKEKASVNMISAVKKMKR